MGLFKRLIRHCLRCCCSCCCCACCCCGAGERSDTLSDIDVDEEGDRGRKDADLTNIIELSELVDPEGNHEGESSSRSESGPGADLIQPQLPALIGSHAKSPQPPSSWLSGLIGSTASHGGGGGGDAGGRIPRGTDSIGGGSRRLSHITIDAEDNEIALRHEISAAMTTAMQRNPLRICFRAGGAYGGGGPRVLRKRVKRVWQRAMRGSGPFAPGSIIGAVAAENHRISVQLGGGGSPVGEGGDGGIGRRQTPASPLLRSSGVDAGGGSVGGGGTMQSANSVRDDLSRASQAFSEASSYYSVSSEHLDSPQLFSARKQSCSSHSVHRSSQGSSPVPSSRSHGFGGGRSGADPPHASPLGPGRSSPRAAGHDAGNASPFSQSSHPAIEAFRAGQLGLGFSGGGFLFPWHLGVVTELQDMGVINQQTQLAGASCGAIIVVCVNSGLDLHDLVGELLKFADDCRTNGTAGRLRYVIEHFLTKALPHDAHLRCNGRTHIQFTRVFPYLKVLMISEYHSKSDLVSAVATSCHIPAYNDGSLVCRFRGGLYIDGGTLRHIPTPPHVAFSAGVSCVPLKFLDKLPGANRLGILRSLAISPDMFEDFPWDWQQLAGLVLVPAPDPVLIGMIEHGKRDARTWATNTGLAAYLSGTMFVPREPSAAETSPHPAAPSSSSHAAEVSPTLDDRAQGTTLDDRAQRTTLDDRAQRHATSHLGSKWAAAGETPSAGASHQPNHATQHHRNHQHHQPHHGGGGGARHHHAAAGPGRQPRTPMASVSSGGSRSGGAHEPPLVQVELSSPSSSDDAMGADEALEARGVEAGAADFHHHHQAAAQWDPSSNAYALRVRIPAASPSPPPAFEAERRPRRSPPPPPPPPLRTTASEAAAGGVVAVRDSEAAASSVTTTSTTTTTTTGEATAAAAAAAGVAVEAAALARRPGGGRRVTIRVQGQGGAPDTLITLEL